MRKLSLPCGCQQHTLPDGEPFIAQHCDKHRHELPIAEACGCIVTRKVGHTHTKLCSVHAQEQRAIHAQPTASDVRMHAAAQAVAGVERSEIRKPDWDDL